MNHVIIIDDEVQIRTLLTRMMELPKFLKIIPQDGR